MKSNLFTYFTEKLYLFLYLIVSEVNEQMKMYVKPSFELEEVLSEDIMTDSPFTRIVGGEHVSNITDPNTPGAPTIGVDVNGLLD